MLEFIDWECSIVNLRSHSFHPLTGLNTITIQGTLDYDSRARVSWINFCIISFFPWLKGLSFVLIGEFLNF